MLRRLGALVLSEDAAVNLPIPLQRRSHGLLLHGRVGGVGDVTEPGPGPCGRALGVVHEGAVGEGVRGVESHHRFDRDGLLRVPIPPQQSPHLFVVRGEKCGAELPRDVVSSVPAWQGPDVAAQPLISLKEHRAIEATPLQQPG